MWLIKNLGWLLIFFLAGIFATQNLKETVSAIHVFGKDYAGASLVLVVLVSFGVGMFSAFMLTLIHHLKIHAAMNRLNRETQDVKRELGQLRNLPLEDLKLGEKGQGRRG